MEIDPKLQTEIEAAAFRRLRAHLLEARPEVQNIDLMNLAGFCRNCLSRWMQEAGAELGAPMSKDESRALFYGMEYDDWRRQHQGEADAGKLAAFETAFRENVGDKG